MNLLAPFRRRRATKAALPNFGQAGWTPLLSYRHGHGDHFPGSWQQGVNIDHDSMMKHHAVFGSMSQIASDVGKMRPYLKQLSDIGGYWSEVANPAYTPVLTKPNGYQNRNQFLESWLWSKLGHGNFFGLKVLDGRNVVTAIYPIDPLRVRPLISTDGDVAIFYQLSSDRMVPGLAEGEAITVPARYVIHDRFNTIHHPLVGMSPLYAAGAPAAGGLAMVNSSARFFQRGAKLSGVLTAPGQIDSDTAKRLEDKWADEFEGSENSGKIAVLGSALKFESMQMSAVDAQLVESMKWSATQLCSVFHMPPWKVGLDNWPRGVVNVQSLQIDYLSSCLQSYVESIESCLSDGLSLSGNLRVGLDETGLLRMDQLSLATYLGDLVGKGIMSPNEARSRINLGPVPGGESPLAQQQNWTLAALADPNRGPASAGGPPAPNPGAGGNNDG